MATRGTTALHGAWCSVLRHRDRDRDRDRDACTRRRPPYFEAYLTCVYACYTLAGPRHCCVRKEFPAGGRDGPGENRAAGMLAVSSSPGICMLGFAGSQGCVQRPKMCENVHTKIGMPHCGTLCLCLSVRGEVPCSCLLHMCVSDLLGKTVLTILEQLACIISLLDFHHVHTYLC
jgi:hypothetical protein